MNVEYIPRKGFAAGRPTQQQRDLPIGARVLREVVVDDQDVAAGLHKILCDACGGIWSDVGETRGIIAFAYHDQTVVHRTTRLQLRNRLRYRRSALADRVIDADDVLLALIENCVDGNSGFARLAVAQYQLPL